MQSSPAKRRKLSPPLPSTTNAPSTPSRIPLPRDAVRTTPGRPSFASPTKASLSRHNPHLLARSASAGPGNNKSASNAPKVPATQSMFVTQSSDTVSDGNVERVKELGSLGENHGLVAPPNHAPDLTSATTAGIEAQPAGGGLTGPPRRKSQALGKNADTISTATPIAGELRETANTKSTEDIIAGERPVSPDPFRSIGHRRPPLSAAETTLINEPREEPDLPLTPTQLGLTDPVVTTPPSGIHNTPSKRKRTRVSKPRPSPLKPQAEPEPERPAKRTREEPQSRGIEPIDPYAEKKRLRDQLVLELEQLKADVALGDRENQRLHQHYRSSKGDPDEPPNPDEIFGLLFRSTAPPIPKQVKPPTIFQSLGAFLPFSAKPRVVSAVDTDPIPSHLPLKLDDPLPYLEAFTNLKYSSVITIVPTTSGDSSKPPEILKQHTITISSPTGLFHSRLNMTVNTSTFSVAKLMVDNLDPNAELELGEWVRHRASTKGVLGRDVSAICWAMGQWTEVATKRARFWCRMESELGTDEAQREITEKLRAGKKGRRKTVKHGDDDAGNIDGDDGVFKVTRKQLQLHMKQTSLVLPVEGVELTIKWDITFDWTGEAESTIAARARMSSECKLSYPNFSGRTNTKVKGEKQDDRRSFTKIPSTFQALVKKRGPTDATRAIVALLRGAS